VSHIKSIDNVIVRVTSWMVAYLTLQMAAVVVAGVFFRYVLNEGLPWVEELARYSMIWLSWLGGGLAIRKGAHIAVDLVVDALPPRPRALLVLVGRILILVFLGICIGLGAELTSRVSMQSTIALGISMQIPYSAIPIGSALMVYHLLIVMFCPWARVQSGSTEYQV
jgi:TRAP-type C4-dicarboxylate transport system permease small subunit